MNWHDHFIYDLSSPSGLVWKRNASNNRVKAGSAAGSLRPDKGKIGYWRVKVGHDDFAVHRIIWEMFYGTLSKGQLVDHKDGNTINNDISNLRVVDNKTNCLNQWKRTNNKSGITGVHLKENGNGQLYWTATWTHGGKVYCKNFSVKQFGHEVAKEMAIKCREDVLARMKSQGIEISERHGKETNV